MEHDDDFERYVRETAMADDRRIEAARRLRPLPLADALVQQGAITAAQRDAVEKKLQAEIVDAQQLGGYRLLRKLGEGGMGAVYLAEAPDSDRPVAIKILPRDRAREPEFAKRFHREAKAATQLRHPNIARAFAAGEERGIHYIVMEYCEGRPLGDRLAADGPVPHAEAVAIVRQVAEGLQYAHEHGVIHRDIKPDNLMQSPDGTIRILDFGLAKSIDGTDASRLTLTSVAMGTPHYLSPEQARGQKEIDGRADIYSLGATFHHLVTGSPPFPGASPFEIVNKHMTEPPPEPRGAPEPIARVIRRMLAKRPEDRHRDCAELIAELDGRIAAPRRSWRIPAAIGIAALLVAGLYFGFEGEPPPVDRSTDLLKLVDPERDAITGRWRRDGEALVCDASGDSAPNGSTLFMVRHEIPEEYDLELVVERTGGDENLMLALVHGGRQFAVMIDGFGGTGSGVYARGGWMQTSSRPAFKNGTPSTVVCSVRNAGLTVSVDGVRQFEWTDYAQLSTPPNSPFRDPRVVVIGSVRSAYRLTRLTLKP